MGDIDEVWHDDRLIGALARGEAVDDTDPAVGPLRALARLAESAPASGGRLDTVALAGERRNHRYAVRSLAVAVTVVATLSTTGVAAVVTGDPLRPAKAVWQQFQHHTAAKADPSDESLHSDDAVADAARERAGDAAQLPPPAETVGVRSADAGEAQRHDWSAPQGPAAAPQAENRSADGSADGAAHAPAEPERSGAEQRRADPDAAPAAGSDEPAADAEAEDDSQARRSQPSEPPPENQDEAPPPAEGPDDDAPDGDAPDGDAPDGEAPDGEDLEPPVELMRTQEQEDPHLLRERSGDLPAPAWSGKPQQTPPAAAPLPEPAPGDLAPAQQRRDDRPQPLLAEPAPE